MTRFDIALRICASLAITKLNLWALKPVGLWHITSQAGYWFGTYMAAMTKRR